MAKTISGHSTPKSAMAMAIVAIPVTPHLVLPDYFLLGVISRHVCHLVNEVLCVSALNVLLIRVAMHLENLGKSGKFPIGHGKVGEIVVCLWCVTAVAIVTK